jgi:hypothetical protein
MQDFAPLPYYADGADAHAHGYESDRNPYRQDVLIHDHDAKGHAWAMGWADAEAGVIASPGCIAYRVECALAPLHHDGSPRPSWAAIGCEASRHTWERNPTVRGWAIRYGQKAA